MGDQFAEEFGFTETVLGGMLEQSAIDPTFESLSRHFFEEESAAWFQNSSNFCDSSLPVGHMVQRAEVEDRIEARIGKGQLFRIGLHR